MRTIFIQYLLLIPCVALYLHVKRGKYRLKGLDTVLKALCTGIVLLTALLGLRDGVTAYSIIIAAGLLMGLIGDVSIQFNFMSGMLFFGIGHLCYIAAILGISDNPILGAVICFSLCLLVYMAYKRSSLSLGKLFIPCAAYGTVILAMLGLAATVPFSIPVGGSILFIGALLFTISDALLAVLRFGKSSTALDTVSLYCYFIGQSLFAASVYYIR